MNNLMVIPIILLAVSSFTTNIQVTTLDFKVDKLEKTVNQLKEV